MINSSNPHLHEKISCVPWDNIILLWTFFPYDAYTFVKFFEVVQQYAMLQYFGTQSYCVVEIEDSIVIIDKMNMYNSVNHKLYFR